MPLSDEDPTAVPLGAAAAAAARPFLICTLQRTGGTNLTNRLRRRSPFATEHEPFNLPRTWGAITRAWKATRDLPALEAETAAVCAGQPNVKHCVEMVPWTVTAVLVAASVAAGYRHLFLYRRDIVGRILSMEYAQRTKVWGPSHIDKAADDARAFETPLDVEALIAHETLCVRRLNRAWKALRAAGARPVALAFEDLYGSDEDAARAMLGRVLERLGLARDAAADAALLAELRVQGDQMTRDRYGRFPGVEALRAQVAALPKLRFSEAA
jgi:LPS sulfotransferase NodH